MKSYLTVWFDTRGDRTSEITQRLMSMGFRPVRGNYDYVYDWGKSATVEDAISLADKVYEILKGSTVVFKLETE